MGSIVMKEAPDIDYYIEWSSVVEAPTWGGDRVSMLAHLWDVDDRKPERIHPEMPDHPETRLKRTDEAGTSALYGNPRVCSWEDGGAIYQQQGWITRADMFVLTRRLLDDEDADVTDLLKPFED